MYKQKYDVSFYGLNNPVNENHCFLNVIIQSLWHLASFRENFLTQQLYTRKHTHTKKELIYRQRAADLMVASAMQQQPGTPGAGAISSSAAK